MDAPRRTRRAGLRIAGRARGRDRLRGEAAPGLAGALTPAPSSSAGLLAGVLRSALDCIVVMDEAGTIVEFNPAAETAFGWTRAEAVGSELCALIIPPEHREAHRTGLARTRITGNGPLLEQRAELEALRRDGSRFPVELTITRIVDGGGRILFAGFLRDLTASRRRERELRSSESRHRLLAQAATDGMLVLDVEEKAVFVNPRLAEMFGRTVDDLLGTELREFIAPGWEEPIYAQWGDGDIEEASAMDLQVRRADGKVFWVRATLGPLRDPDGAFEGIVVLLTDIDDRKREEAQLRARASELASIEMLRNALDEDRLVLLGQPLVDLQTRAVQKHELLVRLRTEDGTLLGPARFLPAAERLGLVRELDRWVVREAMRMAAWGLEIAVNLSARSLALPEFVTVIERALDESGAEPSRIVFEITETAALSNLDGAVALARHLTNLGCGFALDDFGTGFGGFTYLKHLPIDYLKVDREFVTDLVHDKADRDVVETIVGLARRFSARTVAEGAEDEATLVLLGELGVDLAQGFAIGPPTQLIAPPGW